MDLLDVLKKEISDLQLTDKYDIARYIYIRTGELFDYDPRYNLVDEYEQSLYKNYRVNIRNVTNFNVVCYSWAGMYKELLNNFSINAEVKKGFCHHYVNFKIDDKVHSADITEYYEDFYRIKFGLKTLNFYQLGMTNADKEILNDKSDKKINYYKGIYTEDALNMVKDELTILYGDNYFEYEENAFKVIRDIMNSHKDGVSYTSGRKYIRYLINLFLDMSDSECCCRIYNTRKDDFLSIYKIGHDDNPRYYLYQKMDNGYYELNQVNRAVIDFYINSNSYETKSVKKLHLVA